MAANAQPTPVVTKSYAHFLIAGLGAAIPSLCQIIVVDKGNLAAAEPGYIVGMVLRVVLCFLVGGILTHYLYWDERHPGKLFYAGMAAPALFFSVANGTQAT